LWGEIVDLPQFDSGVNSLRYPKGVVSRRATIVGAVITALLVITAPAGAVIPGPNGKIVFTSGRDDGLTAFNDAHAQVWVAEKAGATPVRVTTDGALQHRHASWSPDRTKLVYSAGVPGDFDIYILDLTQPISGANPRNITQSPGIAEDRPSWSPDGTRVAYQSKLLGSPLPAVIITENVTDPMLTRVLTQPSGTGDAGKPVWSADSKTLYYSLVVNPGSTPVNDDIYAKSADNSGAAVPIVTGPTDDYQPGLSPDGQSLCFTRGAFGTPAATVQRSTATGGNVTEIANSGQADYNCAWSPDGTKIAYVQGAFSNGNLMVRNSDGTGTATDLVPNVVGRFDGNPEWTRNPSPICQSRSLTVGFNATASIPLTCVDPAPENNPVTLSIASPPAHGSLGSITPNSITYTPARNFSGADQFTFTGNDGTSASQIETIHLSVQPDTPATISSLKVDPSRWRLGSRPAQISSARAPVGTKISFGLSKPASVRLTFEKITPGRQVHRRCVAPNRSNRRRRRCSRLITAGILRFTAHAGLNFTTFEGRVSPSTKLTLGAYRLTVDATDSAGTRSRSQATNFTIVRH
jgi:dipeptidyl aminopeptidase/acylaminoacyl peptidase